MFRQIQLVGRLGLGVFRVGGVVQPSEGAPQPVIDLQTGRGRCTDGLEQNHTGSGVHTC